MHFSYSKRIDPSLSRTANSIVICEITRPCIRACAHAKISKNEVLWLTFWGKRLRGLRVAATKLPEFVCYDTIYTATFITCFDFYFSWSVFFYRKCVQNRWEWTKKNQEEEKRWYYIYLFFKNEKRPFTKFSLRLESDESHGKL